MRFSQRLFFLSFNPKYFQLYPSLYPKAIANVTLFYQLTKPFCKKYLKDFELG